MEITNKYLLHFRMIGSGVPLIVPWEAESRETLIINVCKWLGLGILPVENPEGLVRFIPADTIDGFEVEEINRNEHSEGEI